MRVIHAMRLIYCVSSQPGACFPRLPSFQLMSEGLPDGRPPAARRRGSPASPPPDSISWWLRPDADYAQEAARMHWSNTSDCKNLIAWAAVGTSCAVSAAWGRGHHVGGGES